jgi:hypothetical protein
MAINITSIQNSRSKHPELKVGYADSIGRTLKSGLRPYNLK